MLKREDLDFAIDKTLEVHPSYEALMNELLLKQVIVGVTLENFTRTDNARDRLKAMESDDVLRYIVEEAIKIYNAASYYYNNDSHICNIPDERSKVDRLLKVFPSFGDIQKLIGLIANPEINISLYLKSNSNDLLCLINSVLKTRFNGNIQYRAYIDNFGYTSTIIPNGQTVNLFPKVSQDIESASIAQKVSVNHRVVNKCLGDLMSGVQFKNKRNEYVLEGTLFASQDIGKKRRNQEDATIILTHPRNSEFKFLAVADGMGGVDYGDKASEYTLQALTNWFINLNEETFYYPEELQKAFNQQLSLISDYIYRTYNADFKQINAGSTFVGAIVTEKKTIVSTVGDSRAYTLADGTLSLITSDESAVWPPEYTGSNIPKEKLDDLRFNRKNNLITRCIGLEELGFVQSKILDNSYDRLLLFSDGVTDILTTDRIRFLAQNTPKELLTKQLIDDALLYDAVRLKGETDEYSLGVLAGKDNATAAAYIRR